MLTMIIFAIFGVIVNFLAAYFTKNGDSLNQKAVNLHMIEDVLGWVVVLIGSILIKFTKINIIDSIMSIGVAIFILIHAIKAFKSILDLFLEKIPDGIEIEELKEHGIPHTTIEFEPIGYECNEIECIIEEPHHHRHHHHHH